MLTIVLLLIQAVCPGEHITYPSGMHSSAGDVWNDIQVVCDDTGINLDNPRLSDLIHDEYESY